MSRCENCDSEVNEVGDFCERCGHPHDETTKDALIRANALFGARQLPNLSEQLLLAWSMEATRREKSLKPDARLHLYERLLSAAKQRNIERPPKESVLLNVAYLMLKNSKIGLGEAFERYVIEFENGVPFVATEDELAAAKADITRECTHMLNRRKIPFSLKAHRRIPAIRLREIFGPFKGQPDLFLASDIPLEKLTNARHTVGVPEDSTEVGALLDLTFWGSAKKAVVFTTRAVYFCDGRREGFIPFSDFDERFFSPRGSYFVYVGGGRPWGPFSLAQRELVFGMLKAVASELAKQRDSAAKTPSLSSVPGMESLKTLLANEVVAPWRDPAKFRKYRLSIPNGILMYGPPGCGKTFIAKSLATELGFAFFEVSPSTVASIYVHGTVQAIRDIFAEAARNAPSVIFIDEIEGLVPNRSTLSSEHQFKAEEVNEFLVQIGSCSDKNVLLIAATNAPWLMDPAIRRTGRFDKKVYVGPPDLPARVDALKHGLQDRPLASQLDLAAVASMLEGYAYSDLKVLCDEAARIAMAAGCDISTEHLHRASRLIRSSVDTALDGMLREFGQSKE